MPAPKRHRGLGMRYSTPLSSYLPLAGRYDSMTRSINHRCQTYADPGSIPPSKLYANPVASLVSSPTPPPPQVPHEHTLLPVNYKHPAARMKQRRVNRPVTTWPARPVYSRPPARSQHADYFDSAQFTVAQTPHSPQKGPMPTRMSPSMETATDHPWNSENTFANIAPVSAAVDAPPAPLTNISAHHPNDDKPRLRAVWQLPHHQRYYPISPLPSPTSIRPSELLNARGNSSCCLFQRRTSQPYNQSVKKTAAFSDLRTETPPASLSCRAGYFVIPTIVHPTPLSPHNTVPQHSRGGAEKM
jgi:hypothetical protein